MTTDFATQELIIAEIARGSLRSAARLANVSNGTCLRLYRLVAGSMPEWRLGAYGDRMPTARITIEVRALSKIRKGVTHRAAAWAVDEHASMVLGIGLGVDGAAAKSTAADMARKLVVAPIFADGPVLAALKRPSALRSCTSDDGLCKALWFHFTVWNLCTLIHGSTPAMKSGLQGQPWAAVDLLRAAGVSDQILPSEDPGIEFSDSLGAAPCRTQTVTVGGKQHAPPNLCALRDSDIKSREFGWLRVIGIQYSKSRRAGRSVPEIERCECRCKCGAIKTVSYKHLMAGEIESCGCKVLEAKFGKDVPRTVEIMGQTMSVGQLATLAGKSPTMIAAAMRRGASAETAAFGTKKVPVQ